MLVNFSARPRLRNRRWPPVSDFIRPERRRFNRDDARSARQRRSRLLLAFSALILFLLAYNFGPLKPVLKSRGSRRASAQAARAGAEPVVFSTVAGTPLALVLPASRGEIITIGYHQAYNQKAMSLVSKIDSMGRTTTEAAARAVRAGRLSSFVMEPRGRGSALDSSVDVALKSGSVVRSPVTGRVLEVTPYLLYGRINDVRIDIIADGYPGFKIALVHLDKPTVVAGQKVEAGVTPLANVRALGISSQIDQYLGEAVAHVHIQVNPIESKPTTARAD